MMCLYIKIALNQVCTRYLHFFFKKDNFTLRRFLPFVFILNDNVDSTAPMHPSNHVTHLSPFGPTPQIYPMISCTQLLSVGKHRKSRLPTVGASSRSYATQTHAAYSPSYCVPSAAPFEPVRTILKPYHTSVPTVKYIEPQMNSIVPMQSISPVTTYNPMSTATSYAQMPSDAPLEQIQSLLPIYIKEEQHPLSYIIEQVLPLTPTPHMSSGFWHPETFVHKKPTFSDHNRPGMHFEIHSS